MRTTIEPLTLDGATVRMLHRWVTHPRSRYWQMGGASADEVALEYAGISASSTHHAWLGRAHSGGCRAGGALQKQREVLERFGERFS